MNRILPLLILFAAFPASGEQTKWIYRNPATLVSIGSSAFSGCSSLAGDIVLPDAVEEINGVWHGTKITSFTAGSGLLSIGASSLRAVYWRSPPDPAKCTGEAPLGSWDWRANGCTNYIPWNPRTQTAAQPWLDFADEYNRAYGEIVLPARRHGVGTLRRTGKSATEYVAYWLPDLDPVTVLLMR